MVKTLSDKRTSARAYELKPTFISLKGHRFRVHDISSNGMGIVLEEGGPRFFIGERIDNIPIPLQNGPVHLYGLVSHISVTTECTVCGIRFIFSGDEFKSIIQFKKERMHLPL